MKKSQTSSPAARITAKNILQHQIDVFSNKLPEFCHGHKFNATGIVDFKVGADNKSGVMIIDCDADPKKLTLLSLMFNVLTRTPNVTVKFVNTEAENVQTKA